jgi:FkbM family methyltransferase
MDNKSVNEIGNVTVIRDALSNETGTASFAIRQSRQAGYGRHSLETGDYEKIASIEVNTVTGDELVRSRNIPEPDVIKIDVEGAGPLVLEGMTELLNENECTDIILETHAPNPVQPSHEDFGYSREDIVEMLEDAGYHVETLNKNYHLHASLHQRNQSSVKEYTSGEESPQVEIDVLQGDIASQSADALVSSSGTSLRMGTGVAGSLRDKAGEKLNEEVIQHSPVDVGDAIITDAYELDAKYVVHAASMPHYGDGQSTPASVQSAVQNALQLADNHSCESVVLPAVGCGLGGVPLVTGIDVIEDVITSLSLDSIETIALIGYTENEYETIIRTLSIL